MPPRRMVRHLFLAGGIGLPRRDMRPRRRVRLPDRQRHPRGLCRTAEAHEPAEESGAMLLKQWQDGFRGEGSLCLHTAIDSGRALMDRSGEAATTAKIVIDAAAAQRRAELKNTEAASSAAPARELAFRRLHIRRPGAGIRRLVASGLQVGGLFEKTGGAIRIRTRHRKLQSGLPPAPSDIFYPARSLSASLRMTDRCLTRFLHANRFPPRIKSGEAFASKSLSRSQCDYAPQQDPFQGECPRVDLSALCPGGHADVRGLTPRRAVCRFLCGRNAAGCRRDRPPAHRNSARPVTKFLAANAAR